jgi:aspartyl-tRNA(Asn)/glutamyl-tRNA(Gln) amidotransferase subunit A
VSAAPPRLRVPRQYFFKPVNPQVERLVKDALERLARQGMAVDEVDIPELDLAPTLQFFTLSVEAAQVHQSRALLHPEGLGAEVRTRLEAAQFVRAVDYVKAQRLRSELRAALDASLQAPGALLATPCVPLPACRVTPTVTIAGVTLPIHPALTRCTLPFNLTGLPAISIPCGTSTEGLPVGLQLAGRFGSDGQLLAAAEAVEAGLASGG